MTTHDTDGPLTLLARIEDEHLIRTLHDADMGLWLREHPCTCEAICHCDE